MQIWDTLLSSALLGTERSQPQLTADAPGLLRHIAADSPEHRLLTAAAVSAAYRRAGYIPPVAATSLDTPAPEEMLPACGMRSVQFLRENLKNAQFDTTLLLEWLEIVARKGKRVPHTELPALLDFAYTYRKSIQAVSLVERVIGERGKWLAAQNPKWAFLLSADPYIEQPELEHTSATQIELKVLDFLKSDDAWVSVASGGEIQPDYWLSVCKRPWNPNLLEAFVQKLLRDLAAERLMRIGNYLNHIVHWLPSDSLAGVAHRLKVASEKNKKTGLEAFIELLEFRRDMLQELAHE